MTAQHQRILGMCVGREQLDQHWCAAPTETGIDDDKFYDASTYLI